MRKLPTPHVIGEVFSRRPLILGAPRLRFTPPSAISQLIGGVVVCAVALLVLFLTMALTGPQDRGPIVAGVLLLVTLTACFSFLFGLLGIWRGLFPLPDIAVFDTGIQIGREFIPWTRIVSSQFQKKEDEQEGIRLHSFSWTLHLTNGWTKRFGNVSIALAHSYIVPEALNAELDRHIGLHAR